MGTYNNKLNLKVISLIHNAQTSIKKLQNIMQLNHRKQNINEKNIKKKH